MNPVRLTLPVALFIIDEVFAVTTVRLGNVPPPPDAVTVTIPEDTADTDKLVQKSMVDAVPTTEPPSFTTIPEPDAVTPVSAEPSPLNDVAVIMPVTLTLPVPVILLLLRSSDPPNCGVVSAETSDIPEAEELIVSLLIVRLEPTFK